MDEPELNEKECDSKGCPGWAVFNGTEIQRCDTCKRFRDDDEAYAYVRALEALDVGRHLEAAAHRALLEIREELSGLIEVCWRKSPTPKELKDELEKILGRSFWLERHRWSEHTEQFARLLSEIHALYEVSEDTETMEERGFLSVKIKELEESMSTPWIEIQSIFERATAAYEADLPGAKP